MTANLDNNNINYKLKSFRRALSPWAEAWPLNPRGQGA